MAQVMVPRAITLALPIVVSLVAGGCAFGACSPSQPDSGTSQKAEPSPSSPQRAESPPPQRVDSGPRGTSGRPAEKQTGTATYISDRLHGRKTFSGRVYDRSELVAAHPKYPMGTVLRVTNEENGRTVEVRIIDRSAAGSRHPLIDLSRAAAERLGFIQQGRVKVTTEVIEWGETPAERRK